MDTAAAYQDFKTRLKLLISKQPELITTTLSNIFSGKQGGRTQEIQRLIGRSLRAATDLEALGERTVTLDCDVLQADGGTRTAAISGAYVALQVAMQRLCKQNKLKTNPVHGQIAAVSVGVYDGVAVLDLDYAEDSQARVTVRSPSASRSVGARRKFSG